MPKGELEVGTTNAAVAAVVAPFVGVVVLLAGHISDGGTESATLIINDPPVIVLPDACTKIMNVGDATDGVVENVNV
jgi:hypothetical protein